MMFIERPGRKPDRRGWRAFASRVARNRERGIYTALFALLLPVLIGMCGLAVDIAHYWWVTGQLQNAADAAALAGAKELDSTAVGRADATKFASVYAERHAVDGREVADTELVKNETGEWSTSSATFTANGVTHPSANAIHVTVQRPNVPSFFSPLLGARASETLSASAIAVAGGAGAVECAAPFALATCALQYDGAGELICPTNLSFQNGVQSVGLTHPDGSSPVNGKSAEPYVSQAVNAPLTCKQPTAFGDTLYLQNGDDLSQQSVDDINAATTGGLNPVPVVLPVVDLSCGNSGPNYNQTAKVVGFIKMQVVGARFTGLAPPLVSLACPTLGKKNVCVKSDCSMIAGTPGGGTIQTDALKVFLVN